MYDQRSLLYQRSLPRNWNHWWREKLGEEETCYHIPSSDCRVFDRLCTFHGLLHSCCISNQREYRYEPLLWSRECVSVFVWLQSMFKFTCLSAHFREGFRRVLTTCWKPTPQDDNVQCFRYFFLLMSQHEVGEKLRSENFAATQTIEFDNAE